MNSSLPRLFLIFGRWRARRLGGCFFIVVATGPADGPAQEFRLVSLLRGGARISSGARGVLKPFATAMLAVGIGRCAFIRRLRRAIFAETALFATVVAVGAVLTVRPVVLTIETVLAIKTIAAILTVEAAVVAVVAVVPVMLALAVIVAVLLVLGPIVKARLMIEGTGLGLPLAVFAASHSELRVGAEVIALVVPEVFAAIGRVLAGRALAERISAALADLLFAETHDDAVVVLGVLHVVLGENRVAG